ncbi:MAG: glycosyltransferase family 4 protein [Ruminococcaceae bacterium]|nr:glycosyltransferase family 4 protein [Oscillospiraceae bacterium]
MSKSKFCVIGNFSRNNAFDGQTIKTLEIVDRLGEIYGKENIRECNYREIKHSKLKLFKAFFNAFHKSEKILVLANNTGVMNLIKVCTLINKIFGRDIYFILVGAALMDTVKEEPASLGILKQLKHIIVETETLKKDLLDCGLERVTVFPNFKKLRHFKTDELSTEYEKPLKLIYMSRIMDLKGFSEMIRELKRINEHSVKYVLDIYGKIEPEFKEEFEALKKDFPEYIVYHGLADAWQTSEIMHECFLHLFPTKCPTEGQPASIIDAFFAGLPTLSARWDYYADMLREGETAVSFERCNFDEFREKLEYYYDHPEEIARMRVFCSKEAEKYLPETVMNDLVKVLES